jgi:hypothetical protein
LPKYANKIRNRGQLTIIKRFVEAYEEDRGTIKAMKIGRKIQSRGYATMKELLKLVKWKFPISIRHVNVPNNTEDDVRKLTLIALNKNLSDSQMIRILTALTGIRERMASAILTLVYPNRFGTFDVNARKALENLGFIKNGELADYRLGDYMKYLKIIRKISKRIKCTPRDIDRALYYYGRHLSKKCYLDGKCPICNAEGDGETWELAIPDDGRRWLRWK